MATGVPHYSALVQGLVNDHRQLLQTFGELKKSADAEDPAAFKQALHDFKAQLVPHLLQEAIKLYTFLRQELKAQGNQQAYQMVNGYKTEMGGIGDAAVRFVETYTATADADIDFAEVRDALGDIGRLLGDRIRREEAELYPLYQSLH
ncbi:MAG: hemerythrin domain-containing protein [Burkholderiales bacterium]|nr:hemerythrin domain-containing protein [Burkholderiales bacterium]